MPSLAKLRSRDQSDIFWLLLGSGVDMVKNILKKHVTPLERKNRRLEALKRKTDKLEQNRLCLTDPEKSNADEP